ncbi:Predicted L-lactate dehydrogenase, hypothetical protein subunit SO1518 [hydrothermal vent metagenome]|uniref:LUD domain-containing protein n=1 Tax=hydrothermal vent metagenome TaxID=652676 RepID=A0A1W1EFK2_9ZZZZ
MSSRDTILNNIRKNVPSSTIELPETNISHMQYADKNEKFSTSLKSVGGNAVWLKDQTVEDFVKEHYSNLEVIVSTQKDTPYVTKEISDIEDPHELENVDLAVVEGHFAVAENGAVWIKNSENRHRALYFLATQLLIVVKKENIFDTMHEAYEKINFEEAGYGLFISGPSKTADIEQALVIGAHGPTDACVLFV